MLGWCVTNENSPSRDRREMGDLWVVASPRLSGDLHRTCLFLLLSERAQQERDGIKGDEKFTSVVSVIVSEHYKHSILKH